jgi:hypothetical protein
VEGAPYGDDLRCTSARILCEYPFAKSIPELSPEELRQILSNVLDFSKKSAVKSFIDSVPEEFRTRSKKRKLSLGWTRICHCGRGTTTPKIREKKGEVETEEWIYGEKPQKVVFVTFQSGKVVSVKEY